MTTYALAPTAIILAATVLSAGSLWGITTWRRSRRHTRSPFTESGLRSPAESLTNQLDDVQTDLIGYYVIALLFPLAIYASAITHFHFGAVRNPVFVTTTYAIVALGGLFWSTWMLLRTGERIRRLRLGRNAEIATAQEMQPLARKGAFILHDVPFDGFNIDHVVVMPQGVFAVETKGRSKPTVGPGAKHVVTFEENCLRFPHYVDEDTHTQAIRQAKTLGNWLSKETGEKVRATPVIAIPGWYVEKKTNRRDLVALNPKNLKFLARENPVIDAAQMKRIVHKLGDRCRDVER